MLQFENKVILVTGAGSGIGLASAKAFALEGAKIIAVDISLEKADFAAQELKKLGAVATPYMADITDFDQCKAMVQHGMKEFGALHIAFNNAGTSGPVGTEIEDYPIEEWNRVMATNVTGMFYAMKAQSPALKASGGTAIVNTASVTSFMVDSGMAGYITSKHAAAGLTKVAALDLIKYGIRVNAICPGIVETPMLAQALATPELRKFMEDQAPIKRLAQPEEIAQAVLFLASEKSSYLVGTLMLADGALSLA